MANPDLVEIFTYTRMRYMTNPVLVSACSSSIEKQVFYKEGSSFDFDKDRFEEEAEVVVSKKTLVRGGRTLCEKGHEDMRPEFRQRNPHGRRSFQRLWRAGGVALQDVHAFCRNQRS